MKQVDNRRGFTLIEIIVVMLLMSIVAAVLLNIICYSVQAYVFARNTDQLSQKTQLAMARLKVELTDIADVAGASATQITYTVPKSAAPPSCALDTGCQYKIMLSGRQITLQDVTNSGTAQILIDGLTTGNGGKTFLSYFKSDGTSAWTTADGFSALYRIKVNISLDNETGGGVIATNCEGSITPRANVILNAPRPD